MQVDAMEVMANGGEGRGVFKTPDGKAITTDYHIKKTSFYRPELMIETGEKGTIPQPMEGQHLYEYYREGNISVGYWKVTHPYGKCIHDSYPGGNNYHGIYYRRQNCMANYFSGWTGYCADCNNLCVDFLVYMSSDTAKEFRQFSTEEYYCYICPNCDNLEQARKFNGHICKNVSANRYFVDYDANTGIGVMPASVFYYNNAAVYENKEVTAKKRLDKCMFSKEGYSFAGWNTKPDGSGQNYFDMQEVKNLTSKQNGRVKLYAQWKANQGSVTLLTKGGKYEGKTDPVYTGSVGKELSFTSSKFTAPAAKRVHFDSRGGNTISDMYCQMSFSQIVEGENLQGKWKNGIYVFPGIEKGMDYLEVLYVTHEIVLPTPIRSGYSFGGWYLDKEATRFAGFGGERFSSNADVTLYALWADLSLEAKENYVAFEGSGASDLKWLQKDNATKIYQVYQKKEGTNFIQVHNMTDASPGQEINTNFGYSGSVKTFTIPKDGMYELTLYGAAGQDINLNMGGITSRHKGGKGGGVRGSFYLTKGDILTIEIGGKSSQNQNGMGLGGKGSLFGSGGGYSKVTSAQKGLLLVAGGGGGAGFFDDGKPGGTLTDKGNSVAGENGESGGGGGAIGGNAGKATIHKHNGNCSHVHSGTETNYGGCYTKPIACGSTDFERKVVKEIFYYGNIDNQGRHIFCVRCGSDDCPGHRDCFYRYVCKACKEEYENAPSVCGKVIRYEINCGKTAGYQCGMQQNQVLTSTPAGGGYSYINKNLAISSNVFVGVREGDGYLEIKGKAVVFTSETTLKNVKSRDEKAPEKISGTKVTPLWGGGIRVDVTAPKDLGTIYEYQVKSFDYKSGKELCTSNICKVNIVSGVYGYYYRIDNNATGNVGKGDTFLLKTGNQASIQKDAPKGKYIHVAAVDKAGNVSETIHISIGDVVKADMDIKTVQLALNENSNVYKASEPKTYYVKADDNTPFRLTLEAFVTGTNDQRIDQTRFLFDTNNQDVEINFNIPKRSENGTYNTDEIVASYSRTDMVYDGSFVRITDKDNGLFIRQEQQFIFSKSMDGVKTEVVPGAGVNGKRSNETEDRNNRLTIIPDGQGPVIEGIPDWESLTDSESVTVQLHSYDTGSGLKDFYVEIHNLENDMVERYEADESGNVSFELGEEKEICRGNYEVLIFASDQVGNQSVYHSNGLGVSLQAYLERILPPRDPIFKTGESGKIIVVTTGYVERIKIEFPDSFLERDDSLNREIIFSPPMAYSEENIEFMVPLYVPDGDYYIKVTGYKEGSNLPERPVYLYIHVEGSVTEEIRTRLR